MACKRVSRSIGRLATKQPSLKQAVGVVLVFSIVIPFVLLYNMSRMHLHWGIRKVPEPSFKCNTSPTTSSRPINEHSTSARLRIDPKVLLFVETPLSVLGRDIRMLLDWNRIRYKADVAGNSLPVLTNNNKGKYSVIVFENMDKYLLMDKWNRDILDLYCHEYNVGLILFAPYRDEVLRGAELQSFPLYIQTNVPLQNYQLNAFSEVLRVMRAGEVHRGPVASHGRWTVFDANHSTYETVAFAQTMWSNPGDGLDNTHATVIEDKGFFDGIRRVFFGQGFSFWLHRPLFLDAVSYLSHGKLSITLER